jgi:hypothetical protein
MNNLLLSFFSDYTMTAFVLVVWAIVWLHKRTQKKNKQNHCNGQFISVDREPYSRQASYLSKMWRQS